MFDVGIDIEEIERFKKYTLEKNAYFLSDIFTEKELDYCFLNKNSAKHLAVRFCAKEAFIKAISDLNIDIKFNEIEILNNIKGKPEITPIKKLEGYSYKVSLSHDKKNAVAAVIIQKEKNDTIN